MLDVLLASVMFPLTFLGGLIVPLLMGASVWIERRKHRVRLAGLSTGDCPDRQHRLAVEHERISRFAPRHLGLTDLVGVWPIAAFAFVLLMQAATSTHPFLDDLMFAVHPIVCVGWWLNMRSRGIIRAEVYAISAWILAHTAWSLTMLAPLEHSNWDDGRSNWGDGRLDGDFVSFVADGLGITSDLALILWLLYVASGIACVLAGVILARADRPIVSPLLTVAVWIPFVWAVLNTNYLFFVLGFVMAVGVAGFGISREVRRGQDDAYVRAVAPVTETRSTLHWQASTSLLLRTAAVIVIAVAIPISVRESGMFNPAAEVAATWVILVFAPSVSALLARLDNLPRVASAWAAWAWMATASVLAVYHLIGPSSSLVSGFIRRVEPAPPGWLFDLIIHPQALAVWLVAVVSFLVAYRTGKLRSYGALLLGLLWFPIATFAASLQIDEIQIDPILERFPGPAGLASMVAMGCVLLVIMWRVFGPEATPGISAQPSAVVAADDQAGPELQTNTVHPLPTSQPDGKLPEAGPTPERQPTSAPES